MIIASLNGPTFSRAGFGQSTFVQGKDFNCNSSICYGIGTANHELFKQLQQAINSFAKLAGFSAITVDGFIGAGTVSAGAQAARFARGQGAGDSERLAQLASGLTKEQIAADAPGLLSELTKANSTLVASGAPIQALAPAAAAPDTSTAPTPAPSESGASKIVDFVKSFFQPSASPTPGGFGPPATPGAPAVPGAAPTTAAAAAAATSTKKVPTWVWIFAGVAGVGILGGIGYAIFHKPAAATPTPAAAKAPAAPTAAKAAFGRRRRQALGARPRWQLRWAPTGERIGVVSADSRREAIRKAPPPYRKYQGEIYAEEIG